MTSKGCGERAVIVAVYTERLQPLSHHHHHHHHHHCRYFHGRRRGYNRKAELLDYARHLRASAQQHESSHVKPLSTVNQAHLREFQNPKSKRMARVVVPKTAAADRKTKRSSPPTCLGKWEFVIPTFLRSNRDRQKHKNSVSAATEMKALGRASSAEKDKFPIKTVEETAETSLASCSKLHKYVCFIRSLV